MDDQFMDDAAMAFLSAMSKDTSLKKKVLEACTFEDLEENTSAVLEIAKEAGYLIQSKGEKATLAYAISLIPYTPD